MKTSELIGAQLDWAVAKCENEQVYLPHLDRICAAAGESEFYHPSTDWSQGGPIIEREGLSVYYLGSSEWGADDNLTPRSVGPSALVAAMRFYVASKLGDEVEVPQELT